MGHNKSVRMIEMNVSLCGLPLTVQGIVEDDEVISVKVLDDLGYPVSWAMNQRQIEGYKQMISRKDRT